MAFRLPDAPSLLALPADLWCRIAAEGLEETDDRVRLAATCRTLRAASVHWFRNDVFKVITLYQPAPPAAHLAWLCRVQAPVEMVDTLVTGSSSRLDIFNTLASGGARIVKLDLSRCGLQRVPAQLAGLAQLRELSLTSNTIEDGWEHVPRQVQDLWLVACGLRQVPAELAALTQLSRLLLGGNRIEGGWERVPRQLRRLFLGHCGLQQVPAELMSMPQLTELWLNSNPIEGGWERLPRQLQQLDLGDCGLRQLLAELAGRGLQVQGCGPAV